MGRKPNYLLRGAGRSVVIFPKEEIFINRGDWGNIFNDFQKAFKKTLITDFSNNIDLLIKIINDNRNTIRAK